MDRGALVAHIDDPDALGVEPHPDRHDVPAAQRENPIDAARLEQPGDASGGAVRGELGHDGCSPAAGASFILRGPPLVEVPP
jgi:hypothetical protein